MKKVSFIAMLTIIYPGLVYGYNYTITDENIRNHSYSVEQISADVYNTAKEQNANAPVFQTVENDETIYYRWYVSDLTDTNNRITNASGSINQNFINNTYQCHSNDCGGGAIYNSSLTSITGDFVNNSTDVDHFAGSGGGAIYNMSSQPINSITGDFINNHSSAMAGAINNGGSMYAGNSNMTITTITGNFINNYGWGYGGAVYNKGNIDSFDSDFISNKLIGDTNSSGGAIYNDGVIGSVDGNFTNNIVSSTTNATAGGAIYNNGLINSINSDFINNIVVGTKGGTGGAIFNGYNGTINSVEGNFIGNSVNASSANLSADYCYGGAIENHGTIGSLSGSFINNFSRDRGGAIVNYGDITFTNNVLFSGNSTNKSGYWAGAILNSGDIHMNIDKDSSVRFDTVSDVITNDGTITATGTTIGTPGHLYLQSVTNSGSFVLNNIYAELAANQRIEQGNFSIDESSTLYTNGGTLIINSLVNNGTIVLDGGILQSGYNASITGSGNIIISGDVRTSSSLNQNTTITDTGSLTASFEDIENSNITNNGLILFSGGNLNKNISNFSGNIGNAGWLTTNANYIDKEFTNRGTLVLTGGTLSQNIVGSGDIEIDGDIISSANISQNVTINNNKSLTISADNIDSDVTNKGVLLLTGGTLTSKVTGITGNMIIGGDVIANTDITQNITINSGKSLTSSVDNIKNANIVSNYGTLWFNGGTLDKAVSSYGNAGNAGELNANANLINQKFVNNGTLNLTEGDLRSEITGSGNIFIKGNVTGSVDFENTVNIAENGKFTTNADLLLNKSDINNDGILNINGGVLKNNVIGGKTIIAHNAAIESTNVNNIDMNGSWNIGSKTVHASNANINGTVNIDVNGISAGSDRYNGGKLIADSINLGDNSELRLVVSADELEKDESTGKLELITADSWNGNWHNIFQTNAKYDMTFDDVLHTVQFTYKKTVEDIVKEMNVSHNTYVVVLAWGNESYSVNPLVQQILDKLNYAAQYDNTGLLSLLGSIAPTESNVVSGTTRSLNNVINNQISDRLSFLGRNGGDMFEGVSVWGQGLYNHSSQSGENEFTGNTFGFSLGADKRLSDNSVLGLGYSLSNTSAKSGDRNIDATGHTVFAYGEYRPHTNKYDEEGILTGVGVSPLYLNATLSYGITNYEDKAGYGISSEYKTNTLGLNGNVGYDITDNFDVFVGARYLKVSQDDYTDSLDQKISVKDEDVITARVGSKYTGNGNIFIPTAHLELSYDVKSSDRLALVNTGHSEYQIAGSAIDPFGVQTGIGFISNINNWNLSLNYDLEWRSEYISHTGRIKAKYVF